MIQIKATLLMDKGLWIALFERVDQEGYAQARHVFGKEPTDPELYQFILEHYEKLSFGDKREFTLEIHRPNPKRLQRQVRKEMQRAKESQKPETFSQEYMRQELEKGKKEKRKKNTQAKEEKKERRFLEKQQKKKEKKKGH